MALLTKTAAQQQLAAEVRWWRANYKATYKEGGITRGEWERRAKWTSRVGNSPSAADSIPADSYNAMANQWCGVNTNVHKKRNVKTDKSGLKIFKEADKSLSGGKNTCHFIESWSDGTKFNWHFKIETPKPKKA